MEHAILRRTPARRPSRARPISGAVAALGVVIGLGLSTGPADAVHDEGFELEGDIENDAAITGIDWVDLFDVTGSPTVTTPKSPLPAPFSVASFQKDWVLPELTGYATGTKDTLPISAAGSDWQCKTPNNLGDKFDLLNAYAAAASPTTGPSAGDLIVYFGSEVSAPEGNRNMGLWLLKDQNVACQGSGNTDFGGSHSDGDVFIVSAFTGGGGTANIDVYEWNDNSPTDNDADVGGQLVKKAGFTGVTCPNTNPEIPGPPLIPADAACAVANTDGDKDDDEAAFEIDTPWDAPDKDGGNLNEAQFLEGAVNLTDLGLSGCFATFLANSRSSQETTSTLHDFARGSFNTCATLNGLKYKDMNGNGDRDADIDPNTAGDQPEPGLGGFQFKLMQGTTQIGSTQTSASDGTYSFASIPAGTYTVVELPKSGWVQTEPANGGSQTVVVGGAGGSVTIGDFGNAPLTDLRVEVDPQTSDASQGTIYCVAGTDLGATPHLDGNGADTGTDVDGAVGATAIWDLNGLKPGEYVCKIVITDP